MSIIFNVFYDVYILRTNEVSISAPAFFPMAYALIKPFLSEETSKKIHVYVKGE